MQQLLHTLRNNSTDIQYRQLNTKIWFMCNYTWREKATLNQSFKMIENSLPVLTIWSPWNRTSVFKSLIPLKIILILRRNICKILWELCWLYILHIYANRLERSSRRRDLYIKFNQWEGLQTYRDDHLAATYIEQGYILNFHIH